jgi:hypothetical protein
MFLGMQNDLIALVAETREELENCPCVEFTQIVETQEPVEMVSGTYCVGEETIKVAKQAFVRDVRNSYLETYIDPVVSNPLRWADLSPEEQQQYADYRRYLLDYTTDENWWEQDPLTFDDWKNEKAGGK